MKSQITIPDFSIIVVTWNGRDYALECLESLAALRTGRSFEVIVADNGSTDGTPQAIRRDFSGVTLIENNANLGFARANNIGIAASQGRYVCLLNSDVTVPSGCFDKILSFMDEHPDIGLLGPKMLSPDGSIGASVMRLPSAWNTLCCAVGLHRIFSKSRFFGGFEMVGYPYNQIDDVEVLTGWFWVIRREALSQVGGLDERFFFYGEDIDWCHRFRQAGWRVVFYPGAEALHYGAASSSKAPDRFYTEMRRANLQYMRKHHSRLDFLAYRFAVWVHEIVRVGGYAAVYCFSNRRRAEAAAKLRRSLACIRWMSGGRSVVAEPRVSS
jgi:GT2 family glycosyltransferase